MLLANDDDTAARFRPRALLTKADAIEIYQSRPVKSSVKCLHHGRTVTSLSKRFNISPKAIRDIWNRRTWVPETQHLWSEGESAMIRTTHSIQRKQRSFRPDAWPYHKPTSSMDILRHETSSDHWRRNISREIINEIRGNRCEIWHAGTVYQTTASEFVSFKSEPMHSMDPNNSQEDRWNAASSSFDSPPTNYRRCGMVEENEAAVISSVAHHDDPFHADWPYW